MAKAFSVLRGYDGDAVFLEDDLRVSPDFFSALEAASQIKQANDVAVFAMGGWAGQNIGSVHHPERFVLKTWSAFPVVYTSKQVLGSWVYFDRLPAITDDGLRLQQVPVGQNRARHGRDRDQHRVGLRTRS